MTITKAGEPSRKLIVLILAVFDGTWLGEVIKSDLFVITSPPLSSLRLTASVDGINQSFTKYTFSTLSVQNQSDWANLFEDVGDWMIFGSSLLKKE